MKKVIKPYEREEAVYYSDFSGTCFGEFEPNVRLHFSFEYGSAHDGASLTFHLTDKEANVLLDLIKTKLTEDSKQDMNKKLQELHGNHANNMEARDYNSCLYTGNNIQLIQRLTQD